MGCGGSKKTKVSEPQKKKLHKEESQSSQSKVAPNTVTSGKSSVNAGHGDLAKTSEPNRQKKQKPKEIPQIPQQKIQDKVKEEPAAASKQETPKASDVQRMKEDLKFAAVDQAAIKPEKKEEAKQAATNHEENKHEDKKQEEKKHNEIKHEKSKPNEGTYDAIKHNEIKHEEIKHHEVKHGDKNHENLKHGGTKHKEKEHEIPHIPINANEKHEEHKHEALIDKSVKDQKPEKADKHENIKPVKPKPKKLEFHDENKMLHPVDSLKDLKKLKSPTNDSEIFNNQSLNDFKAPSTYNKLVWLRERRRLSELKSTPASQFEVTVNNITEKLTFNEFPINSAISKNIPKVVDCLAYIYMSSEDIEEIKKINTEFKYVWSQAIICQDANVTSELETLADEIGLVTVNSMEDFMRKVYNDDRKLYVLLKEVYMKIDKDSSGFIDVHELALAAEQLGENPDPADIANAMREMDLNKDGKINFQEFVYWWKRGRQGAISIQKMAGNIASKLSSNVPGSVDLLRNIGIGRRSIDKTTYTKEFSLRVGPDFEDPKLNLHLLLGKSAKREQILYEANQALSFNMRESWIAVSLRTRSGNSNSQHAQLALDTSRTIISSFLAAAYDGNVLQNSMGVNSQAVGNKIFAGVWLDLNNEKFDTIHENIAVLEKLFRSPVDDYIDLNLQFKNGLKNIEELNEAFKLKVTYVHWVKFVDMVLALSGKTNIATDVFPLSLLLMSGNMEMNFKTLNEVPNAYNPFGSILPKVGPAVSESQQFMRGYVGDNPYMSTVLKEIIDGFLPKIEIIARFNNFGFKLEIEADGLIEYYQGLISG